MKANQRAGLLDRFLDGRRGGVWNDVPATVGFGHFGPPIDSPARAAALPHASAPGPDESPSANCRDFLRGEVRSGPGRGLTRSARPYHSPRPGDRRSAGTGNSSRCVTSPSACCRFDFTPIRSALRTPPARGPAFTPGRLARSTDPCESPGHVRAAQRFRSALPERGLHRTRLRKKSLVTNRTMRRFLSRFSGLAQNFLFHVKTY